MGKHTTIIDGTKDCSVCHERKPLSEFNTDKRNVRTGYRGECRPCGTKQSTDARAKRNKGELSDIRKAWHRQLKQTAIDAYGGGCVCCGETTYGFLTFDHVNTDGAQHRKELGTLSTTNMLLWIKRNNYPDRIQLMCYNCNLGRAANGGVCPHKE